MRIESDVREKLCRQGCVPVLWELVVRWHALHDWVVDHKQYLAASGDMECLFACHENLLAEVRELECLLDKCKTKDTRVAAFVADTKKKLDDILWTAWKDLDRAVLEYIDRM